MKGIKIELLVQELWQFCRISGFCLSDKVVKLLGGGSVIKNYKNTLCEIFVCEENKNGKKKFFGYKSL